MLYKRNNEKALSRELFINPTSEYRGAPFWAWNGALEKEELLRQIDIFEEMGFGGFHMHVRSGLTTEYLGKEHMSLIKLCTKKAKEKNMLSWLYDEDRWPSGFAGGYVTREEKYRARYLLFTPFEKETGENRSLLAKYRVELDEKGFLKDFSLSREEADLYAYLEISEKSPQFNAETYVDTLNPEAIKRFTEITHEKYKEVLKDEFGKTVPAIFTDEPQFTRWGSLNNAHDKAEVKIPWTDRLPEVFCERYGESVFSSLPELLWDKKEGLSLFRYRFYDTVSEMFAQAYADTLGKWCCENGIALTGHLMEEPALESQTAAVGEAMRSYRGFQIPGIDMLCFRHELTTAKQAQSVCNQMGREAMLSELYGVTSHDCDFREYKHEGDWQTCLGVSVRVPHLSLYSMKGEAKRDYPASISYQSPWYKEYTEIENHFARVNTAMTRGEPVVRTAVIHPLESYWLLRGAKDTSGLQCQDMEEKFQNVTKWLLEGSTDFDFISESLLPSLCEKGSFPLRVGKMEYEAVVVPSCITLRKSTLSRLTDFKEQGGKLIFLGGCPEYLDGKPSKEIKKLYSESITTEFSKASLLNALSENRDITIRYDNGKLTDKYIYRMRRDGEGLWLFISPDRQPDDRYTVKCDRLRISIRGEYAPSLYDTLTGEIYEISARYTDGQTVMEREMYGFDSLLLYLAPGRTKTPKEQTENITEGLRETDFGELSYELSEENVLLLDMAEYSLDGSEFYDREEILRLDNICREKIGIRPRRGRTVQPWCIEDKPPCHSITLRFRIHSDTFVKGAFLALENPDETELTFNGERLCENVCGFYIDRAIEKIPLPEIVKGENILTAKLPLGERTNTENMYILGDFGVSVRGREAVITEKPEKIVFGSLLNQGFPFYGGNITYKLRMYTDTGRMRLWIPRYNGALIKVNVDGEEKGHMIYPPYVLSVNGLSKGEHTVALTLFLHRYNAMGPVHYSNLWHRWHGPEAWRTQGADWSCEYILRETGILSAPKTGD